MIRNIIVAIGYWNRGIGLDNKLLWHLPPDMKKFKSLTIGNGNNAVLMGRKTMESLPKGYLPDRDNIVLSNTLNSNINDKTIVFNDMFEADSFAEKKNYDELWIIGGEQIYKSFLDYGNIDNIYVTNIIGALRADAYFPVLSDIYKETYRSDDYYYKGLPYYYQTLSRVK